MWSGEYRSRKVDDGEGIGTKISEQAFLLEYNKNNLICPIKSVHWKVSMCVCTCLLNFQHICA